MDLVIAHSVTLGKKSFLSNASFSGHKNMNWRVNTSTKTVETCSRIGLVGGEEVECVMISRKDCVRESHRILPRISPRIRRRTRSLP